MFSSFKKFIKFISLVIIIIMVILILIVESTLQPILHNVTENDVTGMLTGIINEAINKETKNLLYHDLVNIKTNNEGHIILMQPNLQIVNDLSSNITLEVQSLLEDINNVREIEIPVSQVFGIEVLSRFGPSITANILPYGSIRSNVIDDFHSVGINQTRHKIYLEVATKVKVVVPMMSTDIEVRTEIPLTEAVIVGQVPQVYVGLEKGVFGEGIMQKRE